MVDPRLSIIDERIREVSRIVAVSSGKGGVGKSLAAATLALKLTKMGYTVGLFDLDFTSPSTHVILGIADLQPKEDRGIVPPMAHGMKYMSIIYYSGEYATPLRGADVSNVLIELLSITRWAKLDFLIIDMPPGIGDATLDLIRLVKDIEFLIVTTPSQLAFETVRKLVSLLKELKIPVIGVIENMKTHKSDTIRQQTRKLDVKFLGEIPYDARIEESIGSAHRLSKTIFAEKVGEIALRIQ
ncbi:MAG: Mrp/NBP35 family ATP-binding protein [Candidatus Bathyarchaeota archaeon]|nr:Mrp/NBP35 family ATP-binding protein [Candidatus Bathyarchaeota archaeon]MDH5788027.1 Mrp/NBP35 family ATP-binding protein [Candidatus Bathyarchaeota archaeon]